MLEAVLNLSEGRDHEVIVALTGAAGACLLDCHADPWHHRSVLTMAGDDLGMAVRAVAAVAVERIDLRDHAGAHPRLGALDVVPFVQLPIGEDDGRAHIGPTIEALAAAEAFCRFASTTLGVPCFTYGAGRSLPEIRRRAFRDLVPDYGPPLPHPSAGACCVGTRGPLVAYNLMVEASLDVAAHYARSLRSPQVRALAFDLNGAVQLSTNLVDPLHFGPAELVSRVRADLSIRSTELVGLIPAAALRRIPRARFQELDVSEDRTIEARLEARQVTSSTGRADP